MKYKALQIRNSKVSFISITLPNIYFLRVDFPLKFPVKFQRENWNHLQEFNGFCIINLLVFKKTFRLSLENPSEV